MKKINLTGKVAIVTGAGRGLGKEIALQLASKNIKVILLGTNVDNLKKNERRN